MNQRTIDSLDCLEHIMEKKKLVDKQKNNDDKKYTPADTCQI